MNATPDHRNRRMGRYVETSVAGDRVRAFVPPPLPPDPPIDLLALTTELGAAERAIGRLDGITPLLPEDELFLLMYVRKEAVLSSQIEGTQSTLTDLLQFDERARRGEPFDEVREVSNYVDAMMYGLDRLRDFPLSLRLIRELHARLLDSTRGGTKQPGEFRQSQNWIGGTRPGNAQFVPPPPAEMHESLNALELFIHDEEHARLPTLIRAGLIHVQFETIHPFLDGNGRIGRLLVTLFLCANGVLQRPLLYLSLFLKSHRSDYYRLLQEVRETGNWEAWLSFFLTGIATTAEQAYGAATRITHLFKADRDRITREGGGRASTALRLHEAFQQNPYRTSRQLAEQTGLTSPTVNTSLLDLEKMGIIEEVTGKKRGRVFCYRSYLTILSEGTEPLGTSI